jgi:murein DD-endopeptidase MepM/ murein hydrolase activator NlpD
MVAYRLPVGGFVRPHLLESPGSWHAGLRPDTMPSMLPNRALKPRILAYRDSATAPSRIAPAAWFAIAALGLVAVAAFGIAPGTTLETIPTERVVRELALPANVAEPAVAPGAVYWRDERVLRGDTIGSLLARAGVEDPRAMAFFRTDATARTLYQLRPGRTIRVAVDDDGDLVALRFVPVPGERMTIERSGGTFAVRREAPEPDVQVEMRSGEIRSSLFATADAIGLPDAVTLALAEVFGGDIDFLHDLRRGDHFGVVYESLSIDGEPAGARILAAEFENRGATFRIFGWPLADGTLAYYTEDGRSARRAFLRSPMAFSRVTSGFSLARFHPILQSWRAHRGTDFAAPAGTPARATGDGVVEFAGRQGGYGNVVMLRHGGSYSTLYAHLSRFATGLRKDQRVRQGDTIGYVGATGWATGPHLHYEFRVAGEARNPQTIALPAAEALPAASRAAYATRVAPLAAQLALARNLPPGALAAND